eukprot:1344294-Amorphochlora_amoeboformis.AAC.1
MEDVPKIQLGDRHYKAHTEQTAVPRAVLSWPFWLSLRIRLRLRLSFRARFSRARKGVPSGGQGQGKD